MQACGTGTVVPGTRRKDREVYPLSRLRHCLYSGANIYILPVRVLRDSTYRRMLREM